MKPGNSHGSTITRNYPSNPSIDTLNTAPIQVIFQGRHWLEHTTD